MRALFAGLVFEAAAFAAPFVAAFGAASGSSGGAAGVALALALAACLVAAEGRLAGVALGSSGTTLLGNQKMFWNSVWEIQAFLHIKTFGFEKSCTYPIKRKNQPRVTIYGFEKSSWYPL